MKANKFDRLFPEGILRESIVPFVHKGEWAIHELLPFLLSVIGSAHVRIATFNISEDSLRSIFFLQESGDILGLDLLLDTTVRRHKLELLLFAANITPSIRLTNNHMKVMLIENNTWKVGIVGSANMNNNPRYEAGFIFTGAEHFDYFKEAFEQTFTNDSIAFG